MPYRIELIDEATHKPVVVWDITDAIAREHRLDNDDALTSHILRGLQFWANPNEAQRCARAARKAPTQTHRLAVKSVRRDGPAAGSPDAELIRLRERTDQLDKVAQGLRAERDRLSQEQIAATGEIARLTKQLAQARRELAAHQKANQAQVAALREELIMLRKQAEAHNSATTAAKAEARQLRSRLDVVEDERDQLRRQLGGDEFLTAGRDLK